MQINITERMIAGLLVDISEDNEYNVPLCLTAVNDDELYHTFNWALGGQYIEESFEWDGYYDNAGYNYIHRETDEYQEFLLYGLFPYLCSVVCDILGGSYKGIFTHIKKLPCGGVVIGIERCCYGN